MSVDDRKAINFLIIEEKKTGRASKSNFPRGKADWGKFTDTLKDIIEYHKVLGGLHKRKWHRLGLMSA